MQRQLMGFGAGVGVVLAATLAGAQPPMPAGGGRGGPPMQQPTREILAQFDADKSKMLDSTERAAARAWLATQPMAGRGGMMGGGPPMGVPPGGPPMGGPPGGGPPGGGPPGGGMLPPGGGRGGGRGGGFAPASAGRRLTPADVPAVPRGAFHDPAVLRTLFVDFENADWEAELEAFRGTDVEVPARLRADGRTLRNVGIHFRGASSFMMVPRGSKRSLNLSFDEFVAEQSLHGVRTTNLLNAMNDATFLRTALYSHIARQYIAAPRVNWVRAVVNGEDWGVYLNQQQFNRDFLVDHFKTSAGARWHTPGSPAGRAGLEYLGDDAAPYKQRYELKTKDAPARWASLIRLTKVLNTTPLDQLEAALAPLLDVDGALKFLALELAFVNSDGYWTRASDYSLFEDSTGKFHLVPHDMNEAMSAVGGGGRGGPPGMGGPPGGGGPPGMGGPPGGGPPGMGGPPGGGPPIMGMPGAGGVRLDPLVGLDDASKPLRSRLLAVPALRARYLGYVRDIATQWMDWERVAPLVTTWQDALAPWVEADTRKLYSTERFRGDVVGLRTFFEERRAFLLTRVAELSE